jgi:hypothetical protein
MYFMCERELFVVSLKHRSAFVGTTAGAGMMGLDRLAAFRASGQIQSLDFLMGTALVASRFGHFVLWYRHE